MTVLSTLPAECIDLVVTSPPYDNLREYGGHAWDFAGVARELTRVLKPGGVIVWVVNDAVIDGSESGTSMRQALGFMDAGLRLHDTMIYDKGKCVYADPTRYGQSFEFMFVLAKGKPVTLNKLKDRENKWGGTKTFGINTERQRDGTLKPRDGFTLADMSQRMNIWKYRNGAGNEETTGHPAAFPIALAKDHISSWSNPGDVVLDPFAGSGTSLKAAKELNRHWLGIEINPAYVEICYKRLAQDVLNLEDMQ